MEAEDGLQECTYHYDVVTQQPTHHNLPLPQELRLQSNILNTELGDRIIEVSVLKRSYIVKRIW